MIGRTTIFAAAVATLGLLQGAVLAQTDWGYPVLPAGCTGGAAVPGACDCTATSGGAVASSAGAYGDPYGPECAAGGQFGQHHPNCNCLRCRPRHWWASFDGLMWWGKGRSMPALLTTSPPGTAGILPGAAVLFGDGQVGNRLAGGARADFGFWFDDAETLGAGARVWGLDGSSSGVSLTSADGSTVLARPFHNAILNAPDSLLIAAPGILAGHVDIQTTSAVTAAEAYLRSSMLSGRGYDIDFIGGYHFVRLDDDLLVDTDSVSIDPAGAVAVGTEIDLVDTFEARNEFHGGQVGVVTEIRRGCWTLTGLGKMSVGNMRQTVIVDGLTSITPPGNPSTITPGGMLALPTNMGIYTQDVTAFIPEFNMNLAWEYNDWLRLTMGYSVVYFSNVAFAGDQIDTVINRTQFNGGLLVGPARPDFTGFHTTDYWLHGMTLGVTVTF